MTLLIFYLALAIGVSFLCSILESVLLSLTPSYIIAVQKSGKSVGNRLHQLKSDVDKPLAAILSLNTAAHTIGAAGVGAQAHIVFQHLPTTIISGTLTLLILIFSEIIPKTLGANYWRSLAAPSAHLIHWLTLLLTPLVFFSNYLSRLIAPNKKEGSISREEMVAMADMGQEQGIIDSSEAKVLRSVLKFKTLKVKDVLTPRTVVNTIKSPATVREVIQTVDPMTFSRYPVLQDSEKISGYVLKNDLLALAAEDKWDDSITTLVRPVKTLLDSLYLKQLMTLFLRDRVQFATVIDEFGTFVGIVTLEDIVESLIGLEIMDEGDVVEDMRLLAKEQSQNRESDSLPPELNEKPE